ncbi:MAG: UDPGP type 1 family protein [Verrucomicrobiota bacterium]|nr:UDPGP type 1 family protein [Verrucomicrobiota bacterium]
MAISCEEAKNRLNKEGQAHLLRFWDRLAMERQANLLRQIESLDFETVRRMQDALRRKADAAPPAIAPAEEAAVTPQTLEAARAAGEQALRAREVGVILVAGGQGTRLGHDGPKGCFPIGPITNAPLFEIHARKILARERRYRAPVPFYVMTSRENDAATRDFFLKRNFFGLKPDRVAFFVQDMWPALGPDGRIVLDAPDHIFMNPDGHGGILSALKNTGMLDDMARRGLRALFYFQVDNPLVEIADPLFVGLHRLRNAQMSVKVCEKTDPEEKVGVVARLNDRNAVVEYNELTGEQKRARDAGGRLLHRLGNVAIHVFSLDFLRLESEADLPLHVAHKKVPTCLENGDTVQPEQPNAYKFEKFIFDALPHAERSLNVLFAREDEFSPVKNAAGAYSPETARRDMIRKFARWLEACGVAAPKTGAGEIRCSIEIDPCFADSAEALRTRLGKNYRIEGDALLR